MELLDLFLSPQKDPERIRRLSRKIASRSKKEKSGSALKRTRDDLGFLALSVLALVKLLERKGVVSEQEFQNWIMSLDTMDGLADGKIDTDQLRRALGFNSEGQAVQQSRSIPVARQVSSSQPRRKRKPRRVRKPRSRTAGFTEVESAAKEGAKARPAAEAATAPAKLEVPDIADLEVDAGEMDPAKLGQISYEDYFGDQKKT
jgi:hypothetical protein